MKTTTPPAAESALTAHTPLPWSLPTTNKGRLPIYIASIKDGSLPVLVASVGDLLHGPIDYRETAANAELIVTAVNAHAAAQQRIGDLEKALAKLTEIHGNATPGTYEDQLYQIGRKALNKENQ